MSILKKIDWEILNTYIEKGIIVANKHPEYDIWILNYTPKTHLKGLWDDYTLSCYGMVIDKKGNVLARPLPKFVLYDKENPPDVDLTKEYNIFEKIDGTTIEMFYYAPKMSWIVINSQSFISEQALEAQKIMNAKHNIYNILNKKCTYIFEIIYPEDYRIIKYKTKRALILITRIENLSGLELHHIQLLKKYSKYFIILRNFKITINDMSDLEKYSDDNKEGFVIRFKGGKRIEYKFDNYIYLDNMLSNLSNISIWRNLKNNYDFNYVSNKIPTKQYKWITKIINNFQQKYNEIELTALKEFVRIYHINKITNRKLFAAEAIKCDCYPILYKIFDKKPYNKIIWSKIKPNKHKAYDKP